MNTENHEDPPDEPVVCAACGEVCHEATQIACAGCGFSWSEIAQAEKIVDAVGEALGVDTGTIHENAFRVAIAAVLALTTDPGNPADLMG